MPTKLCLVKVMVFPVAMYGCESWTIKKAEILLHWCIGEDSWEEFQPVNPKGNQSWIFTGRTDADAEVPILWPLDAKNWLIRKDPDAGKDWNQEEKGTTQDEKAGWHHWPDGHEFEQISGVGDGQGSLPSCSPWGHRVRHDSATELNWTHNTLNKFHIFLHIFKLIFFSFFSILIFLQTLCRGQTRSRELLCYVGNPDPEANCLWML